MRIHLRTLISLPSFCFIQAEGYVIGSCIKHIPIAGRDITFFIQQLLREREINIPPEQSLETARAIKVNEDSFDLMFWIHSVLCLGYLFLQADWSLCAVRRNITYAV